MMFRHYAVLASLLATACVEAAIVKPRMWKTKLTTSFPCKLPILGAPMAGVSGGLLAAETARAGALGFVAGGYLLDLEGIEKQIEIFQEHAPPKAPLCIGFISYAALGTTEAWTRFETVLQKFTPQVVQFFAPSIMRHPTKTHLNNVQVAHAYNCQVLVQVGSLEEAQEALDAGVDGLIAQGSEAGGHGLRRELGSGTLPLAARVVSLAKSQRPEIPILAAGGIVDGRGVAAALALGCDGAVLGTRLWASKEALGHKSFKEKLASPQIGPDEVVRTTAVDQIMNTYISTPWPAPYDSVGVIQSTTSEEWDGRSSQLAAALSCDGSSVAADYKKASVQGDALVACVLSGKGVGEIQSIERAYDIVQKIDEETISTIKSLSQLVE